jgi:hypothetical protein
MFPESEKQHVLSTIILDQRKILEKGHFLGKNNMYLA